MFLRIIKIILLLSINIGLIIVLNTKFGSIPPLGKLLDPFNGFWQNSEIKIADKFQTQLKGLTSQDAKVSYDSTLIPHIYAENDKDLYFLQGYVTAQMRLWQMEFQTHAAAGRLSEVIGKNKNVLKYDRFQRRKGLTWAAENFLKKSLENQISKIQLNAFSKGVNAYIDKLSYKEYPLEYKLLDYKPESWTPLKSALLLKYMADMLSIGENDFEYTNALKQLGRKDFDYLFPDMLDLQDPIVNGTTKWDFDSVTIKKPEINYPLIEDSNTNLENASIETPDPDNGSNNWAIGPSKTKSGNPILCNDPHLGLNLPSIWFTIHLKSPEVNVMGASIPGAPNVIVGFNDSIAWGVTNAKRDVVDWYKITFKTGEKKEYLYDSTWHEVREKIEEIKVRGQRPYYDTVNYTHWGPIVYDESFTPNFDKNGYSMRWTAHDESEELLTFYYLNRANNYSDYLEAIKYFSAPAQNIVFASHNGNIALWVQGKFPNKWEEQGKFVMDGSKSEYKWEKYIPQKHNVYTKNPERGYVSSANQHPVDSLYPYYNFDSHYEYYRNRRINRVLDSLDNITVQDMMRLQNDNFNLMASESLPAFMEKINPDSLNSIQKSVFIELKKWNYFNDANEIGASYFEEWFNQVYKLTWDEFRSDTLSLKAPNKTNTIKLIIENPTYKLFDISDTPKKETADDIIKIAYQNAVEKVEEWKKETLKKPTWALYKATYLQHLSRISAFSKEVKIGGNRGIVNATSKRHGASWRMVVELTPNGPEAWGIYPGGQMGSPGSKYYDNMIENWVKGNYIPLNLSFNPRENINETITTQYFKK